MALCKYQKGPGPKETAHMITQGKRDILKSDGDSLINRAEIRDTITNK